MSKQELGFSEEALNDDVVLRVRETAKLLLGGNKTFADDDVAALGQAISSLRQENERLRGDLDECEGSIGVSQLAAILHLSLRSERLNDGVFKDGFDAAIEELGAWHDSKDDLPFELQDLAEKVGLLLSGHYKLQEIDGPHGIVRARQALTKEG